MIFHVFFFFVLELLINKLMARVGGLRFCRGTRWNPPCLKRAFLMRPGPPLSPRQPTSNQVYFKSDPSENLPRRRKLNTFFLFSAAFMPDV